MQEQQNGRRGRLRGEKLEWKAETVLECGEVRAEITSAVFGSRLGFSIVYCRAMPDGRMSKFTRPQDQSDVQELSKRSERWCEERQQRYQAGDR